MTGDTSAVPQSRNTGFPDRDLHDCRTNALISTCQSQFLALIFLGEFASKARLDREGLSGDESQKGTKIVKKFFQRLFLDLFRHFFEERTRYNFQSAQIIVNKNAICRATYKKISYDLFITKFARVAT
jgi:hypothetical protein